MTYHIIRQMSKVILQLQITGTEGHRTQEVDMSNKEGLDELVNEIHEKLERGSSWLLIGGKSGKDKHVLARHGDSKKQIKESIKDEEVEKFSMESQDDDEDHDDIHYKKMLLTRMPQRG